MVSANFLFTPHSARTGTVFSQYSAAVVRHRHWRRQLWGTGARASPLDFQLVILGISRFTDSESLASHAHGFLSSRAFSGHRFCRLSLDCGSALQPLQMGEGSGVDYCSCTVMHKIRKMYKNNAIFAQFLSIFGPFLSFVLPTVFIRE